VIVNNSTNMNKTNNYLSSKLNKHKKDIWHWKSRSWNVPGTK